MQYSFCTLLVSVLVVLTYTQPYYLYSQSLVNALSDVRGVTVTNQNLVVITGVDSTTKTFRFISPSYRFVIEHTDATPYQLNSCHLSLDGTLLAVASSDQKIYMYTCTTTGCTYSYNINKNSNTVTAVRISDTKTFMAAADMSSRIYYFNGASFSTNNNVNHCSGAALAVALSSDASIMVGGCMNGNTVTYLLNSSNQYTLIKNLPGNSNPIYCVDLSSDGQTLISGSGDNILRVFKGTGANFPNTPTQTLPDASDSILSCAISSDATTIVTGSRDRSVRIYYFDGSSYKLIQQMDDATMPVLSVAISTNKSMIVTGS